MISNDMSICTKTLTVLLDNQVEMKTTHFDRKLKKIKCNFQDVGIIKI